MNKRLCKTIPLFHEITVTSIRKNVVRLSMRIVAIDFETASSSKDSACEIGVTLIEQARIVGTYSWLIKPPCWPKFEYFNSLIHGITPQTVAESPRFNEVWEEIQTWFQDALIVAHNAEFDIGVLREMLSFYQLPGLSNAYVCTYQLSRKIWPEAGKYGLKSMIQHLSIEAGKHHRAASDSRACAEILLQAMHKHNIFQMEQLAKVSGTLIHNMNAKRTNTVLPRREIPQGDQTQFQEQHPFFAKNIVFTGTLDSMSRAQAWKRVADIGAHIHDRVDHQTAYVVAGYYEGKSEPKRSITRKHTHALQLNREGASIVVLNELAFIQLLENGRI